MTQIKTRRRNRRHEPRMLAELEQLYWAGDHMEISRPAWLNDISYSGISFLVEENLAPTIGQCVQVRWHPHQEPIFCEVVRIASDASGSVVVGCKRGETARLPLGISPVQFTAYNKAMPLENIDELNQAEDEAYKRRHRAA